MPEPDWTVAPVFGNVDTNLPRVVRFCVYAIMPDDQSRIAVVRTPKGTFLPGGGQEFAESVAKSLEREVREECGLNVRLRPWSTYAIEHVDSEMEKTHFEKRSIFREVEVLGQFDGKREIDHDLCWSHPSESCEQLSHRSHAWAVQQWIAARN